MAVAYFGNKEYDINNFKTSAKANSKTRLYFAIDLGI